MSPPWRNWVPVGSCSHCVPLLGQSVSSHYTQANLSILHVVICRIAIDKAIQEKTVKWHSPIVRTRMIGMVVINCVVLKWIRCILGHVYVPVDIAILVPDGLNSRGQGRQRQQPQAAHGDGVRVWLRSSAAKGELVWRAVSIKTA